MEINVIDQFFLKQTEPLKGSFLALRTIILAWDSDITEHWKYKLPFYYYQGKPFCYLWKDKKTNEPYIGLVRSENLVHPSLFLGSSKRIKKMRIDSSEDIPVQTIYTLFEEMRKRY